MDISEKMDTKEKKYVYIAGPYTQGDLVSNIRNAVEAAERLTMNGFIPFIPHLTMLWDLISKNDYAFWIEYDNNWLLKCDYLVRLDGESPGADKEIALAHEHNIPVYYSIRDLFVETIWS